MDSPLKQFNRSAALQAAGASVKEAGHSFNKIAKTTQEAVNIMNEFKQSKTVIKMEKKYTATKIARAIVLTVVIAIGITILIHVLRQGL